MEVHAYFAQRQAGARRNNHYRQLSIFSVKGWSDVKQHQSKNRAEQNIFYLHGALPFFDNGAGCAGRNTCRG